MRKMNEKTAKTRIALISLSLAVMLTAMAVTVIVFSASANDDQSLGAQGDPFEDGDFSFVVDTPWDAGDPLTHGTVIVTGFASTFTMPASYVLDLTGPWVYSAESLSSLYDVIEIDTGAFANETGITGLVLPSTVTIIGAGAFDGDDQMAASSLDLSNVTSIGAGAFYDCELLSAAVTFSSGLTHLGVSAFFNTGLTSVDLSGTSLTAIPMNVFQDCAALTTVVLPSTVTAIDGWAFDSCLTLVSINLDNVRDFGDCAFNNCNSLALDAVIATSVGTDAFYGCSVGYIVLPLAKITDLYNNRVANSGTGFIFYSGMTDIVLGLNVSGDVIISAISPAPAGAWELRIGTSAGADDLGLFDNVSGFTAPVSIPGGSFSYITLVGVFDITYVIPSTVSGSAVNANPTAYAAGDRIILQPLTVPTGYRFMGWLDESNAPITEITGSGARSITADVDTANLSVTIVYGGEAPFKPVFEYMVSSDGGVTWPASWTRVEGNVISGMTIGLFVKIRSAVDNYAFEWDTSKGGMSTYVIDNGELTFEFDQTFVSRYDASVYGDYTYTSFSWAWFIIAVTMIAVAAFFIVSILRKP